MKKEWTGVAYHYEEGPIVLIKYNGKTCCFEIYERGSSRKHLVAYGHVGNGLLPWRATAEMHDKAYEFATKHFNLGEDDGGHRIL